MKMAKARVIDLLRMFSEQIWPALSDRRGAHWRPGPSHWATFANLIMPLPEAELPADADDPRGVHLPRRRDSRRGIGRIARAAAATTKLIWNCPFRSNDSVKGKSMLFKNRVTEMLGIEIPIVQAPMGWIARAQLASAVSNAGGLGIIETSSGELDEVRDEIREDARPHRQAVRREHRAALRARPGHRRLRRRPRREVRHHLGRRSRRKYTRAAEGRGAHGVPRRAVAARPR